AHRAFAELRVDFIYADARSRHNRHGARLYGTSPPEAGLVIRPSPPASISSRRTDTVAPTAAAHASTFAPGLVPSCRLSIDTTSSNASARTGTGRRVFGSTVRVSGATCTRAT